jgi:poly-gamma-glutamate system protein
MKAVYRIPYQISRPALLLMAGVSVLGIAAVERFGRSRDTPDYEAMISATRLATECMATIKAEALQRGIQIQRESDPTQSGLIGVWLSPVTSSYGSLGSKQTSVNPNFAAVVVKLLRQAGVQADDCVAVAYSGSFPAVNACVCAALQVIRARPVIVASAASSQWGANRPELLWIDMEAVLYRRGLIGFRSVAASLGGGNDRAERMPEEGRRMLRQAIERNSLPYLSAETLDRDVQQRMEIYQRHAAGRRIGAYVNVGGAIASNGPAEEGRWIGPGLTLKLPAGAVTEDSAMSRFADAGIPVINLVDMYDLAPEFGLPWRPRTLPPVGEGRAYGHLRYNRPLAGVTLAVIIGGLLIAAYLRRRSGLCSPRWGTVADVPS